MEGKLRETVITVEENEELREANKAETAARNMLTLVPSKNNREWYIEVYDKFNQVWDKLLTKYYPDLDRDVHRSHADFEDSVIYLTKI